MPSHPCPLTRLAVLTLCLGLCPGAEPRPGETSTIPVADLPRTLAGAEAQIVIRLPSGYDAAHDWPVFLWLNGGTGAPGLNTQLADGHPFILVSMPLFKRKDAPANEPALRDADGEVLAPAFRRMMTVLERQVPNIDERHSIIGGFSNGANAIKVLSIKAPEVLRHFGAVLLNDGGVFMTDAAGPLIPGPATDPIFDVAQLRGRRLLGVGAEKMAGRALGDLCALAGKAGAQATHVVMRGKGHSQVSEGEELKATLQWVGDSVMAGIPEAQAAMKAGVAAKKWPAAVAAYRELARYCDPQAAATAQVEADLAAIRAASDQAAGKLTAAAASKDAHALAKDLRVFISAWQPVVPAALTDQAGTLAAAELDKAVAAPSASARRDKLQKMLADWRGFPIEPAVRAELDKLPAKR